MDYQWARGLDELFAPIDIFGILVGSILLILYGWTIYNFPALLIGLKRTSQKDGRPDHVEVDTPTATPVDFSVVVAAKNEERVILRLLNCLRLMDYPKHLYEVIVVEDGSTDATRQICERFAEENKDLVRFHHRETSNGKPSALNFALKQCNREIVLVLDADNVPSLNLLKLAAKHFQDPSVNAVQGMTLPINADQNMITKLGAYEEAAWFRIYLLGKQELDLFVPLTGSCGFVRRALLVQIGGWDEKSLAEDVELAARLTKNGHKVKYAPEIKSWQEYPAALSGLIAQRTRWFRGYMETWVRYGSLVRTPTRLGIDAEATLFGPFMLNLVVFSYSVAAFGLLEPSFTNATWFGVLAASATVMTLFTLLVCGIALAWHMRPFRLRNLVWIPAVYSFWFLQTMIALRALVLTAFGCNRSWVKTKKSGFASTGPIPVVADSPQHH